jgi:hypothetical protein
VPGIPGTDLSGAAGGGTSIGSGSGAKGSFASVDPLSVVSAFLVRFIATSLSIVHRCYPGSPESKQSFLTKPKPGYYQFMTAGTS